MKSFVYLKSGDESNVHEELFTTIFSFISSNEWARVGSHTFHAVEVRWIEEAVPINVCTLMSLLQSSALNRQTVE